jgi:AAA domain
MHTAIKSSPSYDFRKDFSDIARPGMIAYQKASGFDPDEPSDGEFDDCWAAGNDYVKKLWRHLKSCMGDYRDRGSSDDLELYGVEGWTRESVEAYVEQRLEDILVDMAPTAPVDVYRAVHLGTEMARKQNAAGDLPFMIEVEPEAVAYAADRLKSKLERNLVSNPVTEVYSAFLSYRFLKERSGGNVVYLDRYRQLQPKPEPSVARAEAPEPKPDIGAQKRDELLLSSWLKLKLPLRDYLLGDIMSTTSRWIIYGETGVGKTLFGMDMSGAIASGRGMLNWAGSGVKRRVMYLDGELPAETFKERMEIVARQYGPDIELYGYCRDILGDDDMPPLNKPEGVKWLEKECRTIQPEVIVFDSIMCLLTGNMAEEESWAPITPMLRQISQQRCAQIWLHHTGHDTSKGFGTKTREWQMDTVLSLTKDAQNDEHLLMEFKKARLRTPDTRAQFESLKITCEEGGWAIIGGADKRRGAPGDRGAAKARAFMEAYDRLAYDAPNSAGFNGKPVRKVALDAVRKEMRSRGALGDSTPGLKMTSAEYKAFDSAKEANTESKKLIEADGFVWR